MLRFRVVEISISEMSVATTLQRRWMDFFFFFEKWHLIAICLSRNNVPDTAAPFDLRPLWCALCVPQFVSVCVCMWRPGSPGSQAHLLLIFICTPDADREVSRSTGTSALHSFVSRLLSWSDCSTCSLVLHLPLTFLSILTPRLSLVFCVCAYSCLLCAVVFTWSAAVAACLCCAHLPCCHYPATPLFLLQVSSLCCSLNATSFTCHCLPVSIPLTCYSHFSRPPHIQQTSLWTAVALTQFRCM